jgi:predicted acylesterase/phospholipase RssA
MRAEFNPFDLFLGTSAGAQNLSAYLCNQPGYARKVIMRYTTAREFFDPVRFVRGGNLIDLDWLITSTSSQMPLAMDYAARVLIQAKPSICAPAVRMTTRRNTSPDSRTWLDIIRASSAIPGFYRPGVTLNGVNYLDGGVSDAIPVQEAAKRGAKPLWLSAPCRRKCITPRNGLSEWNAGWEKAACSLSLTLFNIMRRPIRRRRNLSKHRPVSCAFLKSTRRSFCTAWRWEAVYLRCGMITNWEDCAGVISWRRWVNCWQKSRH